MRLFLDSAVSADVRWATDAGLIDGVTTNPSLLAEAGVADPRAAVREIADSTRGPVSAEVLALDADGMYREGRELARLGENVTVLVPVIEEGLIALRRLVADGVRAGATLVFSPAQALVAARAGAASVTVFVGRLDDVGQDGMSVVTAIQRVFADYDLECDLVAAELRSAAHVSAAAFARADAAAVPAPVLRSILAHPLTDRGLDQFLSDWGRHLTRSRAGA